MSALAESIEIDGASNDSPFHEGEQRIQQAQGVREDMEHWGRRVVRDHLPEEHAGFYAQLPYLVVAARDPRGRPWATLLTGAPGFATSPDPQTLAIAAVPGPGDALARALEPGVDFGVLGIELHTRRRNRVNGRVRGSGPESLVLAVDQTFGNCPQHIQLREWRAARPAPQPAAPIRSARPSAEQRKTIEQADTFFIATGHTTGQSNAAHGMDASHRGGCAGFVRFDEEGHLSFPDYAGNNHFNTLGNLVLDDRAGLLFVDFTRGSLLQLTGKATIDWAPEENARRAGAQRTVRFAIEQVVEQNAVLPMRFSEPARASQELEVVERIAESEDVTSFYLARPGHGTLPDWQPGQHLPIEATVNRQGDSLSRTYSLSNAPGSQRYRISVKREPLGRMSRHLHDTLKPGDVIHAGPPAGDFALDTRRLDPDSQLVLVGAGIGITPLASMLHALARTRPEQPVTLVHGVRDGAHHPLGHELRWLIDGLRNGRMHVRYSRPRAEDIAGGRHDDLGRIDGVLLEQLVRLEDSTFYLCGPLAFMGEIQEQLAARGVASDRIHFEAF